MLQINKTKQWNVTGLGAEQSELSPCREGWGCPGSIWNNSPDAGTNTEQALKPLMLSENGFSQIQISKQGTEKGGKMSRWKAQTSGEEHFYFKPKCSPSPLSGSHHMGGLNIIKGFILLLMLYTPSQHCIQKYPNKHKKTRRVHFKTLTCGPFFRAWAAKTFTSPIILSFTAALIHP